MGDVGGWGGFDMRRFCLPSSILISPPLDLKYGYFNQMGLACLRLVLLCLSVCTRVCECACMCDGGSEGGK